MLWEIWGDLEKKWSSRKNRGWNSNSVSTSPLFHAKLACTFIHFHSPWAHHSDQAATAITLSHTRATHNKQQNLSQNSEIPAVCMQFGIVSECNLYWPHLLGKSSTKHYSLFWKMHCSLLRINCLWTRRACVEALSLVTGLLPYIYTLKNSARLSCAILAFVTQIVNEKYWLVLSSTQSSV